MSEFNKYIYVYAKDLNKKTVVANYKHVFYKINITMHTNLSTFLIAYIHFGRKVKIKKNLSTYLLT